jgi:hypothetical protein
MDPDALISQLVHQSQIALPDQLAHITRQVAAAPFAEDLLEVDEPLWGSFWQGDVIAPGYRLPAVELAWLRAIRLDKNWPQATTIPQFLADLRQAILAPRAGIWTLAVAGEPCVLLAASTTNPKSKTLAPARITQSARGAGVQNPKSVTAVWYCASTGRLHAGYRTSPGECQRQMRGALKQRGLESDVASNPTAKKKGHSWLAQAAGQSTLDERQTLAARLDLAILRVRAGTG